MPNKKHKLFLLRQTSHLRFQPHSCTYIYISIRNKQKTMLYQQMRDEINHSLKCWLKSYSLINHIQYLLHLFTCHPISNLYKQIFSCGKPSLTHPLLFYRLFVCCLSRSTQKNGKQLLFSIQYKFIMMMMMMLRDNFSVILLCINVSTMNNGNTCLTI